MKDHLIDRSVTDSNLRLVIKAIECLHQVFAVLSSSSNPFVEESL